MKYQNLIFNLPMGYEINEAYNGNITITNKLIGVGAITISRYEIPTNYEFIIQNELNDFLITIENYSENLKRIDKQINKNRFCTEFVTLKKIFWKIWIFYEYGIAIFISYNCEAIFKRSEVFVIDEIVKSIQIKS
ncbi:MAG: hypothetical protein IPJ81_07810 [Chitinophagaceae bacterium]|nr:hypothetical protein [Chitinophagaceae bacterium]